MGTGGGGGGSGGGAWLAGDDLSGTGLIQAIGGTGGAPGGNAGTGGTGGLGRIRLDVGTNQFTGTYQGAVTTNAVASGAVPVLV
jgi:hypothetical protein